MKTYVITTGTIFGLIAIAHVVRILAEGTRLMKEPMFLLMTVLAAGLCAWAWNLLRTMRRTGPMNLAQ
ncbi:MAG: hypothetical protein ACJ8OJ_11285 [Povalibacter sp.]